MAARTNKCTFLTILRAQATCISYMSCHQSVIHANILLNCFKSALKRFLKSISCPLVILCYDYCIVNSLHVKESKTVLDSKFHSLESGSPDTAFQIPRVSGSWVQDSKRYWDSGFLELYCGFHMQKFPGFRKLYWTLHGAITHSAQSFLRKRFPLPCDINRCDTLK